MKGQYSLFNPTTCEGSRSVISSPGSADGPTPCDSPDGPTSGMSGPGVVPVSRGRQPARALAPMIRATFGLRGFSSYASADLASSLVSRLRVRLDGRGSIVFTLTWKDVVTPSGRSICRLRASARGISGNGTTSWPTPMKSDGDGGRRQPDGRRGQMLREAVFGWGWPTPTALSPAKKGRYNQAGQSCNLIQIRRLLLRGRGSNGLNAETESVGQLNPALSRWLMGYPPAWCDCAVTAMPSTRTSRKK